MKYILPLIVVFCLGSFSAFAQDAIDLITEKTCSCMRDMDTTQGADDIQTALGLCMIKEAAPYEKDLKKKYHIDLSNLDKSAGEQLGKLVGEKMITKCPDQMTRLMKAMSDNSSAPEKPAGKTLTGVVTEVVSTQFVVVTIKDPNGHEVKFIWLEFFKGSDMLKNVADIKGKTVQISYTEAEYYNPAIKDYMKYKVITGLTKK